MKLTLSILVSVLLLTMCVPSNTMRDNKGKPYSWEVIEIDSCEYIYGIGHYKGFLAHKGNCKYCEQRRKKVR